MVMIISIEWLMKMMIFHAQDELCVSNEDIVDNEDDCDEDWWFDELMKKTQQKSSNDNEQDESEAHN